MTYLASIGIILTAFALWIAVQHGARVFAARHPELGPAREEGEGCGGLLCVCRDPNNCPKRLFQKSESSSEDQSHSESPVL